MKLNDKLHIAWKRIKVDRSTDFIIGDFEYEVFDYYKKDLIGNLEEKIVKQEDSIRAWNTGIYINCHHDIRA